jgi:hypothetical protein
MTDKFTEPVQLNVGRTALQKCHGLHCEFRGEAPGRISVQGLGPKKAMESIEAIEFLKLYSGL